MEYAQVRAYFEGGFFMGKEKKKPEEWVIFLQGSMASLWLYLAGIFLAALFLVKGVLPEGVMFPVVAGPVRGCFLVRRSVRRRENGLGDSAGFRVERGDLFRNPHTGGDGLLAWDLLAGTWRHLAGVCAGGRRAGGSAGKAEERAEEKTEEGGREVTRLCEM